MHMDVAGVHQLSAWFMLAKKLFHGFDASWGWSTFHCVRTSQLARWGLRNHFLPPHVQERMLITLFSWLLKLFLSEKSREEKGRFGDDYRAGTWKKLTILVSKSDFVKYLPKGKTMLRLFCLKMDPFLRYCTFSCTQRYTYEVKSKIQNFCRFCGLWSSGIF